MLDATVLSAFALADRIDLIRDHLAGTGAWTLAVYHELLAGIRSEPRLGSLVAETWLGEPREMFDVARVEDLRRRLGGRLADDRHLGEATSIVLAEQMGAGVLIDDRDGKRLAESLGLRTGTTISVLRWAIRGGSITPIAASCLIDLLVDRYSRKLPRLDADQLSE